MPQSKVRINSNSYDNIIALTEEKKKNKKRAQSKSKARERESEIPQEEYWMHL